MTCPRRLGFELILLLLILPLLVPYNVLATRPRRLGFENKPYCVVLQMILPILVDELAQDIELVHLPPI